MSHVLLVDASREDRMRMRGLLHAALGAAAIAEADRGAQALAICQATRPDCVLLDDRLPDMEGLALLAALRALGDVPLIALITQPGDRARYLAAGASAALAKPLEAPAFAAALKAALSRPGAPSRSR